MSWASPVTWTTGASGVVATALNQQLRDNLKSLRNGHDILVQCSLAANQSLAASNTDTGIGFTVHDSIVGTTALHSTASGAKFNAPSAGWYGLTGSVILNTASGTRAISYRLNGTGVVHRTGYEYLGGAASPRQFSIDETVQMTTADYLEVTALFLQGTSATIIGGATGTRMAWHLLGAST